MQIHMSLALCVPQSSWFSLNFALRKLFASGNWYCLRKNIFIKVHNTIPRMHESRVEEAPKGKQESTSVCLPVSYRLFTTEDLSWLQNSNVKSQQIWQELWQEMTIHIPLGILLSLCNFLKSVISFSLSFHVVSMWKRSIYITNRNNCIFD